jgi:hypothetical protein
MDVHLLGIQPVAVHLGVQTTVSPESGNGQPGFHFCVIWLRFYVGS